MAIFRCGNDTSFWERSTTWSSISRFPFGRANIVYVTVLNWDKEKSKKIRTRQNCEKMKTNSMRRPASLADEKKAQLEQKNQTV